MTGRIHGDLRESAKDIAGSPVSALSQAITQGFREGCLGKIGFTVQRHRGQGSGEHSQPFLHPQHCSHGRLVSSLLYCSAGCGLASSGIGKLSFEGCSEAL